MKSIFFGIAMLFAASANAQTFGIHLASVHDSYKQDWNDANPGLYLRLENGATIGTFKNSERSQSVYAGWSKDWSLTSRIDAGIMLGGITGYQRAKVLPMAVPSVRLAVTETMGIRTSFIFNPRGASAVHLSAEWKL